MSQALPTRTKRRRTEEPEGTGESPPAQSKSYWFDDGSVIIQAENTQYRVHRSLLSRHSNIFKDMFSLPQPAADLGPTFEGCPVILLSDKAADLEHVLSVIYDGIRVHDMRTSISVDFLGAILRLGKKYDITYLYEEGLKRLRLEFPATLEEWRACSGNPENIHAVGATSVARSVIGLCHELSIPRCLPGAYFLFVASFTLEYILGSSVDDGGVLERDIITQCVLGRDKFIRAYHGILKNWIIAGIFSPSNSCDSWSGSCAVDMAEVFRKLEYFNETEEKTQNEDDSQTDDDSRVLLDSWDEELDLKLCRSCFEPIKLAYESTCKQLWSKLPDFFGLQPWDELKDFDM